MELKMAIPVIGITGSAGKTTTKEMTASILKTRWKNVLKSEQSNNCYLENYINLLDHSHQAVVLEFSVHRIKKNCELLQPTMAAITNISTEHMDVYGCQIEGLIKAKSKMIKYMDQSGDLFLNIDDTNSKQLDTRSFKGKVFTIGILNPQASYFAYDIVENDFGITFHVDLKEKKEKFFTPALGKHNVYNALFALAFADKLGFTSDDIRYGLKFYEKPASRLQLIRFHDRTIIDDSFSSSLIAAKAAINVLAKLGNGLKVAVLGPTGGALNGVSTEHLEIGQQIVAMKIDFIFTLTEQAKDIGLAAINAGFPRENVIHSSNIKELHRQLREKMWIPDVTFLVKGSVVLKMYSTTLFLKSMCSLQGTNFQKQVSQMLIKVNPKEIV